MDQATEANYIISTINKLLDKNTKKIIKKLLPNIQELLSSKFITYKGSLKVKKKNKGKTNKKKKGGSPFFSKKYKTINDVRKKVLAQDPDDPLTKQDAAILIDKLDTEIGKRLKMLMESTNPPGFEDIVKPCLVNFNNLQEIALDVDKSKDVQKKTQSINSRMKNIMVEAFEIAGDNFVQQNKEQIQASKMVEAAFKNIEDNTERNKMYKKVGNYLFYIMITVGIAVFIYTFWNTDILVSSMTDWMRTFTHICKEGQNQFKLKDGTLVADRPVAKEAGWIMGSKGAEDYIEVCTEGSSMWGLASLFNYINNKIATLVQTGAQGVDTVKYAVYLMIFCQWIGSYVMGATTVYITIIKRLKGAGEGDAKELKEAIEIRDMAGRSQGKLLGQIEAIKGRLTDTHEQGRRGAALEDDNNVEELEELEDVTGALKRKSKKKKPTKKKPTKKKPTKKKKKRRSSRTKRR